ncbi:MAG: hypothetical protein V4598_16560 [Bdellovibrionota bacterium]
MKYIFIVFCLMNLTESSWGKVSKKKTAAIKKQNVFKNLECKQKILPLRIDYKLSDRDVEVVITGEKDIQDFQVTSVVGLDGVKIIEADKIDSQLLKKNSKATLVVEFDAPIGLSYISMNLKGTVNKVVKNQVFAIPVGELSSKQKSLNGRNIRINSVNESKVGGKASEEKIHEMKLETKKK